jgi:hypothetical protein
MLRLFDAKLGALMRTALILVLAVFSLTLVSACEAPKGPPPVDETPSD